MAQGRGPDYELVRFVDCELRRFLDSQGANAPALRTAEWEYRCAHDEYVLRLGFHGPALAYHIRLPRDLLRAGRVTDLQPHHIVTAYSRLYEDHLLELQLEPMRLNIRRMAELGAPGHVVADYRRQYEDYARHLRRHHSARLDPPMYFGMDPAGPGNDRTAVTMRSADMTATEVVARQQQVNAAIARAQQQFANDFAAFGVAAYFVPNVGDEKAEARGLALLKAWLSSEQLASYEKHNYFEVIGGHSGKRYRINHGRQMNIDELDTQGNKVCGWCFLPEGQLVAGDVMLAQKIALETNERAALKVANRFRMRDGHWQRPLPIRRGRRSEEYAGQELTMIAFDEMAEVDLRPGAVNYVTTPG